MPRYEITGSGVGDSCADWVTMCNVACKNGARNVRRAYHHGYSNQPYTIRFTAQDDVTATAIGEAIREHCFAWYREKYKTSLIPMLRAYGLHWAGWGKP